MQEIMIGNGGRPPRPRSFGGSDVSTKTPDMILDSVQLDAHTMKFYIDFVTDSAALSFSVADSTGNSRYFPMYCSTYRELPAVYLDVFVSDNQEDLWVYSSWPGYEILAYYKRGSDTCMTRYGENIFSTTPTPESISGGSKNFPEMDQAVRRK